MSYVHVPIDLCSSKDPDSCTHLHRQLAREDTSSALDDAIAVTDHWDPSPVYYSNRSSSDTYDSNTSIPASGKLELSDLKPELLNLEAELSDVEGVEAEPEPLLKRLFGNLVYDPRWPNICGVDKTVAASLNDWIVLYLYIQSDPSPYKLFSFTYDLQKHTIHMSTPSEIHQAYVQATDETICETAKEGIVVIGQFEPVVVLNNSYNMKGPTPDSGNPAWSHSYGQSVARKEEAKKNREATALAREQAKEAKAADKAAKVREESKKDNKSSESSEPDDSHAAADRHAGSSGASGSKSSAVVPSSESPQRSRAQAKSSQPLAPPEQRLNHIPGNAIFVSFPLLAAIQLPVGLGEIGKSEDEDSMTFSLDEYMHADHPDKQCPLIVFVKIEEERQYSAPTYDAYVKDLCSDEVVLDPKSWAQTWIDIYNKQYNSQDPAVVCDDDLGLPGDNWLSAKYIINNHVFMHRHRAWLLCADLNMPEDRLLVEELRALPRVTTADWERTGIAIPVFASKPEPKDVKRVAYDTFSKRWDVRMQNTTRRVFKGCVNAWKKAFEQGQEACLRKYGVKSDDIARFKERIAQGPDETAGWPSLDSAMRNMRTRGTLGAAETAKGRLRTFVYKLADTYELKAPEGEYAWAPPPIGEGESDLGYMEFCSSLEKVFEKVQHDDEERAAKRAHTGSR